MDHHLGMSAHHLCMCVDVYPPERPEPLRRPAPRSSQNDWDHDSGGADAGACRRLG